MFKKCYWSMRHVTELLVVVGLGSGPAGLDVREVIVEFAQVVVVPLIVQSWKEAAAGQLWQIL